MQRSSASGRTSYRASSWPSPGLPWLGAIRRTRAHRLEARQRARAATIDVPLHVRTSLEILAPDTEAHHAGHRLNLERPASVSGRAQAVRRIRPRDDEAARLRAPLRESTPCCYQHLDASRVNWCPLGHVLVFHYSRVNSPLSSACQTISADAACRSRNNAPVRTFWSLPTTISDRAGPAAAIARILQIHRSEISCSGTGLRKRSFSRPRYVVATR